MGPDELAEHAVKLAAAATELSEDVEERVAAMHLDPTLRDRTLLLIEQTRMLAERSSAAADDSDRLRALADEQAAPDSSDDLSTRSNAERMRRRNVTADARDHALSRREASATAREDTLAERETTAGARERTLDVRERSVDLSDASMRLREQAVAARSAALNLRETVSDESRAAGLDSLAAAVEDGIQRWVKHANHELRQPLTVINGVAETLRERGGALDDDTRSTLVERLHRQSLLMQHIIDQLEHATRLRATSVDITRERTDLRFLVEQVREDYEPLLSGVAITYRRPERPVMACVDPSMTGQILLVLLRNAADHAPCNEPLLIETISGARTVRLSLHDDGTGIAAADREHVFAYGTRLNSAGRLGLGLFIARGLARAQGGDITIAESPILGGARFDVTLPADCDEPVS